jgi:tRNA uridine 5-carboxymethylaminomethyl modification enzyme
MDTQEGDEEVIGFSYTKTKKPKKQLCCWITHTNQEVHDILRTGFDKSPMFSGRIKGVGPRYCPSVEDKIDRFSETESHQLFVEPEGWSTCEISVNGFSTSLPEEIQYKALVKVPGFENMKMFRPGYAIEYDYFPPTQLSNTLETKLINNLFFAGQINGTTGYEEAACQGLMAGINAHQKAHEKEAFILHRNEAYIGVLIDDLINKGTEEPYRMFTSRAEYRILLRQDNADIRLTEMGHKLGLASDERLVSLNEKKSEIQQIKDFIKTYSVNPEEINSYLISKESAEINQKMKLDKVLARPNIDILEMIDVIEPLKEMTKNIDKQTIISAEIELKYMSYIEKEVEMADKMQKIELVKINPEFEYSKVQSLSIEARQKLAKIKPTTLGQASRISGVSPADISVLMVMLGR